MAAFGSQVQPMFWVAPPLEVTPAPKLRWSSAAVKASIWVWVSSLVSAWPLIRMVAAPAEAVRLSPMSLSLKASEPLIADMFWAEESPVDSATLVETAVLLTELSTVWSLVPVMVMVTVWVAMPLPSSIVTVNFSVAVWPDAR